MTSRRRISHWIACLAVLVNLLAMPLHAKQMQLMEQMPAAMMADVCASHTGVASQAETGRLVDVLDPHPHKLHHGECCCCGAGGMAGPPSSHYRPQPPPFIAQAPLQQAIVPATPPRLRWTSLNPRASPLA